MANLSQMCFCVVFICCFIGYSKADVNTNTNSTLTQSTATLIPPIAADLKQTAEVVAVPPVTGEKEEKEEEGEEEKRKKKKKGGDEEEEEDEEEGEKEKEDEEMKKKKKEGKKGEDEATTEEGEGEEDEKEEKEKKKHKKKGGEKKKNKKTVKGGTSHDIYIQDGQAGAGPAAAGSHVKGTEAPNVDSEESSSKSYIANHGDSSGPTLNPQNVLSALCCVVVAHVAGFGP